MADAKSLLSLIARGYAAGREDAATEALCFILSRSKSARDKFAKFLRDNGKPLPITRFSTQFLVDGAFPDMACLDDNEDPVAFVESKFWASLTPNQPVTYWEALPDDRPAVLLFLAPASRIASIDEGWLWHELVKRLRADGHNLGSVNWRATADLVTATSKDGLRRLMLTSWKTLLNRLAQAADKDDAQACFELAELQGLAEDAIEGTKPQGHRLEQLIADAVSNLEKSGWANTDGRSSSKTEGVAYVKFFRLAGASAGLRIDYKAEKEMGKPLWLRFWSGNDPEVRARLGELVEPGLKWIHPDYSLPVDLPGGADCEATLEAIVAKLECVARVIDTNGPTYPRDSATG